jgi:ribose transport system ATP-binding protein
MTHAAEGEPRLTINNLSKSFEGRTVVREVSLRLRAGEVHALLGQNGSGKSTLIKVLAGYYTPDSTSSNAEMNGVEMALGSPTAAYSSGLRFIHQDLGLVEALSVVENLNLGPRGLQLWLSHGREQRAAQTLMADAELEIDVRTTVSDLSPAEKTMVAVVRALRDGIGERGVLVLDEPTATLPEHEVQLLFSLIDNLRRRGVSILFVTHRLDEVFTIADRVTVLRDGEVVGTEAVEALDTGSLVQMILGRPVEQLYPEPPPPLADLALVASNLQGAQVKDLSFQLRRGEILGVAGLTGSGREEVGRLLFGAERWRDGHLEIHGRSFAALTPAAAIAAGIAYVPPDRKREAALLDYSLRENLTLPKISSRGPLQWVSLRSEANETGEWLRRFEISPADAEETFSRLSGGNQQRVIMARSIRCEPSVLVCDEPSQGVDVGAKGAIYQQISGIAEAGAGVVLVSTDHDELAAVCDRVLVFREGRIAATLTRSSLDTDRITEQCIEGEVTP